MPESVLVFGAHPDDCEIGAGGTMAAYAKRGHRVVMVNLRVPAGCDDSKAEEKTRRRLESEDAARILGVDLMSFALRRDAIRPDARLVTAIDRLLLDIEPSAVFTHWIGDSHPEHVAASRAVLASTRRNRCSVYMYEPTIPGGVTPHAFRPQKFIDISDTIDTKIACLSCYETQVRTYGEVWLEAIRGRAAYRGFQIGRRYAEAFQVVKEVSEIPEIHR